MPAEWTPHEAVWTAWPHDPEQWAEGLSAPQAALMAMVKAIVDGGRGERVELLVRHGADETAARALLGAAANHVRFRHAQYGDVWLRDTGPLFVVRSGEVSAVRFAFDGWAGKYVMPGDADVAARVLAWANIRGPPFDLLLEPAPLEHHRSPPPPPPKPRLCAWTRHPCIDPPALEARLRWALGVEQIIWLDQGLANDHTDGHIDTLARFVAPGVVACMEPVAGDPNGDALDQIIRDLKSARPRPELVTVPSPGAVRDAAGNLMPASYMNFYIANTVVVVPTYGVPADERAVATFEKLFRTRKVVGLPCKDVVVGGGGFHCTTQQQPRVPG